MPPTLTLQPLNPCGSFDSDFCSVILVPPTLWTLFLQCFLGFMETTSAMSVTEWTHLQDWICFCIFRRRSCKRQSSLSSSRKLGNSGSAWWGWANGRKINPRGKLFSNIVCVVSTLDFCALVQWLRSCGSVEALLLHMRFLFHHYTSASAIIVVHLLCSCPIMVPFWRKLPQMLHGPRTLRQLMGLVSSNERR